MLVLHDLNEADRIVAMRDGQIAGDGPPADVLTASTVQRVFGLHCQILQDPETGQPVVVPSTRRPIRDPAGCDGVGGPRDTAAHRAAGG